MRLSPTAYRMLGRPYSCDFFVDKEAKIVVLKPGNTRYCSRLGRFPYDDSKDCPVIIGVKQILGEIGIASRTYLAVPFEDGLAFYYNEIPPDEITPNPVRIEDKKVLVSMTKDGNAFYIPKKLYKEMGGPLFVGIYVDGQAGTITLGEGDERTLFHSPNGGGAVISMKGYIKELGIPHGRYGAEASPGSLTIFYGEGSREHAKTP